MSGFSRTILFGAMLLASLAILAHNTVERRQGVSAQQVPYEAAQADLLARMGVAGIASAVPRPGPPAALDASLSRPLLERSIGEYRKVLAAHPDAFRLSRRIGVLLGAVEGPPAAWQWFREHPDPRPNLRDLWRTIYAPGEISRAEAVDAQLTISREQFTWYIELARAQVLRKSGQPDEADQTLRRLRARLRPGVLAFTLLGTVLFAALLLGVLIAFVAVLLWRTSPATRASFRRTGHGLPFGALTIRELAEPAILWFFTYTAGGLLLRYSLVSVSSTRPELPVSGLLGIQLAMQVAAASAGAALLWSSLRRRRPVESPVPPPIWQDALWGIGGYLAALPLVLASALFIGRLLPHMPTPPNPGATLALAARGPLAWVLLFLLVSVGAPLVEELFFRGVLYTLLRKKAGVAVSVLVSAGAFALVHPQLPLGFVPIFILGALFACLVELRRSLVPSIVAHALNNSAALILASLLRTP